jgi:hypothetical protein
VYHVNWAHFNGILNKFLCQSVCLSVCLSLLLLQGKAWLSISLHSVVGNGSTNTFPRQRIQATIEEMLDIFSVLFMSYRRSVCWSVYPLSLLDNNSVNTFPRQRRHFRDVIFHAFRAVWKASRLLVLHRSSFLDYDIQGQHVSCQRRLWSQRTVHTQVQCTIERNLRRLPIYQLL